MSKRYRVRKKNAEKQERSREITGQFYDNVIKRIKEIDKAEQERIIGDDEIMKKHLEEGGTPT